MELKNFGFHYEAPTGDDYLLGGFTNVPHQILQADGNWINFLPLDELQQRFGVETNSCVSFGTCNQVEILHLRKFGSIPNYSDRYLSIASETTPTGNTPNKVYETARKIAGFIPEELLPFSEDIRTLEEYSQPKPLNKKYYDVGRKWLNRFDFKHEWITTSPLSLMQGLQYSPLGISVTAWIEDERGFYVRPAGLRDNHWTLLVGYVENEYWIIYDSYPGSDGKFLKKLAWNFWDAPGSVAKGISLELITRQSWLEFFFKRFFSRSKSGIIV